ncbi:MAG TPA: methyl-accepting chemotaxis protein [Deltaproteobacteria bacterium]|nr:methyl-accepting chemotaxis protein [Deltaproteobacteria bacterium]HPR51580.1 methyl-accepting chemotaxis protein [Deltaproteobacteria bacterium]
MALLHLRLRNKLIFGGIAIVLVPMLVVAFFSVMKASSHLESSAKQSAREIAQGLADLTDKTMSQELKLAKQISLENTVISMASTVERFGLENTGSAAEQLVMMLSQAMHAIGEEYEGIMITDNKGIVYADGSGGKMKGRSLADRDYFAQAKKGTANIGSVLRSETTGKLVVPVCAPIFSDSKKFMGCVVVIVQIDYIVNKLVGTKVGETGYAFMINKQGIMIAHPNPEYVLKLDITKHSGMEQLASGMIAGQSGIQEYTFEDSTRVAGFSPVKMTGWSVGATQPKSEYLSTGTEIRNLIALIAAVSLAFVTIIIIFFARGITTPLANGVDVAKMMAQGDFTHTIDVDRQDEIGDLAEALKDMVAKLGALVNNVKLISNEVYSTTNEVASGAQGLSQATQEQAAAIEQIAATIEEIASAIKMNASNANQGLEKAKNTKNALNNNLELGGRLTQAMDDIYQSSGKIEEIIVTVNEVAFQTNLLALNAAVEAARAGEHGKGFAVVAEEVRSLAQKTAEASKQIKVLIEDTLSKIHAGNDLVKLAETSLNESVSYMDELSDTMDEIASSSSEQANGVDELNRSISQIETLTQQNASTVEELASASESMSMETKQLSEMVDIFKTVRSEDKDPLR